MALTLRTGGGLLSPASAVNSNKNTRGNNGGLIGGVGYLAEKSALGFLSSVEGIWDYSAGGVAKLFGVDKWAERQFANDWVNYTHADEWYDPGKGWQIAGDVAGGIGTSMPAIAGAAGAALITYFSGGTAAPAAAKLLSASVAPLIAGFGAAGSATKEAYQKTGNLGAKEFGYGALSGATEAAIEGVTAGIGTGTGRIVSALSKKAAGETVQTLSKSGAKSVIKHLAADFASEAVEEGLAEAIDPLYQKLTIDPNAKAATAQEIGYAALVGGLSGLVMSGGAATVNTIANLSSGNAAINSGNAEKIIKTASSISAYEDANDTGYESYKAISADYKALSDSLKQTGGQITTAKQRMLLGSLKKAETAAFVEPFIERSAENLLLHADSAAERFSAFGMTDADGKEIHVTADEIRSGVDADLIRKADSGKLTEAEQKTFTKQVRVAMRSNSVLATLATMDATGRITMDARKFAEAAREGADIATAADINAFAETASQEEIRDLAADLGIADWAAITPDEFREKTAAFAQSDRGRELSYQSRRIRAAMGLADDSAVELPKAFRGDIAEGATRYRTADGIDMAIIREGDRNYIYNYASGNISRAMSEADVNKILADYWSGNKKAADDARLALSQNNVQNNAENLRNNAELLGVAATARYNMLAAENIKGWRRLSEPVKQAVRMTMRQAEAAGLSEDTAITFGRVAAHSGMNIVFDSIRSGAGDALQTGNTIYVDPGADKSRIEKRLLIHEMAHALIKRQGGWQLLTDAFFATDPARAKEIEDRYIAHYKKQGLSEAQYMPIVSEEIAVAHLENVLGRDGVWDYMLADEPSLGEKVLNFFRGSARDYADDAGLSAESRKLLTMYRKMFRELSEKRRGGNALELAEQAKMAGDSESKRFAFAGDKAKTADKMKLDTAKKMIQDGKDSESVRRETGWFKGYDGKWRFEIDDSGSKYFRSGDALFSQNHPEYTEHSDLTMKFINGDITDDELARLNQLGQIWGGEKSRLSKNVRGGTAKLEHMIQHDSLFAAYPQLRDVRVLVKDMDYGKNGTYLESKNTIEINSKLSAEEARKALLHEIQHAVQSIEGFTSGGNLESNRAAVEEVMNIMELTEQQRKMASLDLLAKYSDMVKRPIHDKLLALAQKNGFNTVKEYINSLGDYSYYERIAGEVEARDVARRSDMDSEQRKNTRPDVDREDVVFADSAVADSFEGWTANGIEVYTTSQDVMKISISNRIKKFRNDFLQNFKGKTAKFERNGHVYYARFVESVKGLGEFVYESKSPASKSDDYGYKAKIRLLADGDIFNIVEDGKYKNSSPEKGKKTISHQNAKYWDYFWKEIFVDGKGYDVVVNIRNDSATGNLAEKEQFVYSLTFRENKKVAPPITTPATQKQVSVKSGVSTAESISQNQDSVNRNSEKSSDDRFALPEEAADGKKKAKKKYHMSHGQLRADVANKTRKKAYSKADARATLEGFTGAELLTKKVQNELADYLWQGFNTCETKEQREKFSKNFAQELGKRLFAVTQESPDADLYRERITYLGAGIGRLMISSGAYAGDFQHRLDKDGYKRFRARWSFGAHAGKKGFRPYPVDQFVNDIAGEMPGMEYLREMHPADAMLEIDKLYTEAKAGAKEREAMYSQEEAEAVMSRFEEAIMQAFEERGHLSVFQKRVSYLLEQYADMAEEAKAKYDEINGRNEILGRISAVAQKMKDLKLGTFKNSTQMESEVFIGAVKELAKIEYRGNLSVKKAKTALRELAKWYRQDTSALMYVDDQNSGYYNAGVAEMLNDLTADDEPFTKEQLMTLHDVLSYFTKFAENYGKIWRADKWVEAKPIAERYVQTLLDNEKIGLSLIDRLMRTKYLKNFGDPASVVRQMDRYQRGFYTEIYEELRAAAEEADVLRMNVMTDYDAFMKKNPKYIRDVVKQQVVWTEAGRTNAMPKMTAISLYMTSKREQAQAGLALNGFKFKDADGKVTRTAGAIIRNPDDPRKVTQEEISQAMTDLQNRLKKQFSAEDLAYIKILEKAYGYDLRLLKAERDMQKMGFTNAILDYYYPIRRADIAKSIDVSAFAELDRVSNASFNKNTVQGARGKLFIEDADALFQRHATAVTRYAALSPAIENFNILFNMDISGNPNDSVSVATVGESQWEDAKNYFRDLIGDIQGVPKNTGEFSKELSALRSHVAMSQLGANPKTWVTQFSSLFAASSRLDPASIMQGMRYGTKDVDIYCDLAKLRNYDAAAIKAQGVLDRVSHAGEVLMKPIAATDRLVVRSLWGACQVQVQKNQNLKLGTDENKVAAGKLLTEVLLETQQNSLATEKSSMMRSGNEILRALTMFSADGMKVTGRYLDGLGEVSALKQRIKAMGGTADDATKEALKQATKRMQKALAAMVSSAVFSVAIAEGFRLLYAKEREEDESAVLDMILDFTGNMLGGLPGLRDVYTFMVDGYELDNYAISAVNDLLSSVKSSFGLAFDLARGEGDPAEIPAKVKSLSYATGQFTGIPVRNIYNLLTGLTRRFSPVAGYQIDRVFYSKNYRNDLREAVEAGDTRMVAMLTGIIHGKDASGEIGDEGMTELNRLAMAGANVMPRTIGKKITVNGEEIELTKEQRTAITTAYEDGWSVGISELMNSPTYANMTDEQREDAIRKVHDISCERALLDGGFDRGERSVILASAVGLSKAAVYYATVSGIVADVDRKGNKIEGSRRAKTVAAIEAMTNVREERLLLLTAAGYSLQAGDFRFATAEDAKRRLLRYIVNMKGVSAEEKAAIAQMCGFDVKNGKISAKSLIA